jgi:hypothetical protein
LPPASHPPARFPRAAHNVPQYPPETESVVYEGAIEALYETQNQFADSSIGFQGIRGVKTCITLIPGNTAARYVGEHIDGNEAHHRNINGEGGMIAFSRSYTQTENNEDVFIDGAIGGNISRLINHHCDNNHVNVKLTRTENGLHGLDFIVCKKIPIGGDLYFNNGNAMEEGMIPEEYIHRCFCKGFDPITHLPICTKMML